MTFRRRHRWTRRFLIGLAFAAFVAPAQARPIESTSSELGLPQQQETPKVISYLSHGITGEAVKSRQPAQPPAEPKVISYLSHGMTAADALDPRTSIPLSAGIPAPGDPFIIDDPGYGSLSDPSQAQPAPDAFERAVMRSQSASSVEAPKWTVEPGRSWYLTVDEGPVRPDDRGDRFVVGDGTPVAPVTDGDGFTIEWQDGLTVGIGALAFALALGLAVAHLRRPRIAGL